MKKLSSYLIVVLWIYLLFVGGGALLNAVGLSETLSTQHSIMIEPADQTLVEAAKLRNHVKPDQLALYDKKYEELVQSIDQIKGTYVFPYSVFDRLTFLLFFMTSFFFIWAGVKVLFRSKNSRKIIHFAVAAYFARTIFSYMNVFFIQLKFRRMFDIMAEMYLIVDPQSKGMEMGIFDYFKFLIPIGAAFFLFGLLLNVIIPYFLISRKSVKEQLTK